MTNPIDTSIIIPCFNESESLPLLKEKLAPLISTADFSIQLVFVDDGSTDSTNADILRIFSFYQNKKIIKHERNSNLGAAVRTGILNSDGKYIAAIDADGSYNPVEIIHMRTILIDNTADCISGSAVHPKAHFSVALPWYRHLLSHGVCTLYNLALFKFPHFWFYSYTAIFRLYRADVIKKIKFKSNTFMAMAEILCRLILGNYKIIDIPSNSNYRVFGYSKAKIKRLIFEHLGLIFKIIFFRIIGKEI